MSLPRPLRLPAFLLGLVATLPAAENKSPARFPSLMLADGRQLSGVEVKSYDAVTDRFLVVADRKMVLLAASLVSEPVRERLKIGVPRRDSAIAVVPVKPAPVDKTDKPPADPTPAGPVTKPAEPAPAAPAVDDAAAREAARLEDHRTAVLERAMKYFRDELPAGTGFVRVNEKSFVIDAAEAVPGWPDRYRSQGRVQVEHSDRTGGRARMVTERFEVLTEQKPGEEPRVIDFSRK